MLPIISAGSKVKHHAHMCVHTHIQVDVHNSVCVWVSLLASMCVLGSQGHASEIYGLGSPKKCLKFQSRSLQPEVSFRNILACSFYTLKEVKRLVWCLSIQML